MVLPVLILSGVKALFAHVSAGRSAIISLSVHNSLLTISSDQEPAISVWHHGLEGETVCPRNLLSCSPEGGGHQLPARLERCALR